MIPSSMPSRSWRKWAAGGVEEIDDRGYVEPEPEVYRRFMLLAQQTAEGLERFG